MGTNHQLGSLCQFVHWTDRCSVLPSPGFAGGYALRGSAMASLLWLLQDLHLDICLPEEVGLMFVQPMDWCEPPNRWFVPIATVCYRHVHMQLYQKGVS